jgi:cytidyltransferase-like protein
VADGPKIVAKDIMKRVVVTGGFDQLGSKHVRFLEDASKLGELHVLLWSDEVVRRLGGSPPKFPEQERFYLISAIRYVSGVRLVESVSGPDGLSWVGEIRPDIWVCCEAGDTPGNRAIASALAIEYRILRDDNPRGFERPPFELRPPAEIRTRRKRVIVTGCFDWLHSGHVRFFEEASELGDLYVVVGHDANIKLLKGEGHPLFPQAERRYLVGAVRYVTQALISSGHGWMDAEPEIALIRPDIYFVNEDGDKPEKRAFCEAHGIELIVSERIPKHGLPVRHSTDLRGF